VEVLSQPNAPTNVTITGLGQRGPVGGDGSNFTIYKATSVGGTANALAITTNGIGALSATEKLIFVTIGPASNTGPATATFDGGAAIPIRSRVGALLANELVEGTTQLWSVTSTAATILFTNSVF
jgi:hypothetical protein